MTEPVNPMVKALEGMVEQKINGIHTAMPGTVLAYSGGVATVQPSLPLKVPDGRMIDMPPIVGVPVVMPAAAGGTACISLPVQPGDGVLLIFAERSIDDWAKGGDSDDPRRFDMTDAIAIPGLYKTISGAAAAHPDAIVMTNGGAALVMPPAGPVTLTGADLIVDGISIKQHVHGGVVPGGGNTGEPT